MKKSSLVISLAVGLLVVAVIFIALLPAIVTSDTMKPFVIQKINQQLPGDLQLKSWSAGWFGGIEAQGIAYDNPADGVLAKVSGIKSEKGLLGLIVAGGNLGTVDISDPAVVFIISDTADAEDSDAIPPSTPRPGDAPFEKKDAFIPGLYGTLNITNGTISTAGADGGQKVVARNLDLMVDAPGPKNRITYRFSMESGDGSGHASGKGSLVPAADDPLDMQKSNRVPTSASIIGSLKTRLP